jgi:hypothetical protein
MGLGGGDTEMIPRAQAAIDLEIGAEGHQQCCGGPLMSV